MAPIATIQKKNRLLNNLAVGCALGASIGVFIGYASGASPLVVVELTIGNVIMYACLGLLQHSVSRGQHTSLMALVLSSIIVVAIEPRWGWIHLSGVLSMCMWQRATRFGKTASVLIGLVPLIWAAQSSSGPHRSGLAEVLATPSQKLSSIVLPDLIGPSSGSCAILISIDTIRFDVFYAKMASLGANSSIGRASASAQVFRNAWAQAPWTLPSMTTLLSGVPPSQHGAGYFLNLPDGVSRAGDQVVFLPEILQRHGLTTAAVTSNRFLSAPFGFARGIDYMENLPETASIVQGFEQFQLLRPLAPLHRRIASIDAHKVTNRALSIADKLYSGSFWLWVHYMDPHEPYLGGVDIRDRGPCVPYNPKSNTIQHCFTDTNRWRTSASRLNKQQREEIRGLYEGDVELTVRQIDRLLAGLEKVDPGFKRCVYTIVGDHGEELWDHGGIGHGHSLNPEILHVPYFFWGNGVRKGQYDTFVGTGSYPATVLTLLSMDVPPGIQNAAFDGSTSDIEIGAPLSGSLRGSILSAVGIQTVLSEGGAKVAFDLTMDPMALQPLPADTSVVVPISPQTMGAVTDLDGLEALGYIQ
jgi:arylsulfatase A-like enzyme